MCGIRIQVGHAPVNHRQLDSLRKRGPDGMGYWSDGTVHMAQTRLAIVGLGRDGDGPMVQGDLVLAYNGEIYNYLELAERLELQRPVNDAAVLLAAWALWGTSCLEVLEGFWSFALYDKQRRELHLVRDQFGVKPLYYRQSVDSLVAASMLDAIGPHTELDMRAIGQYALYQLTFGDRTFFADTRKVMPGEHLTYRVDTGELRRRAYEALLGKHGEVEPDEAWINETRTVLVECVRAATTGDRAYTTTCSGGLDSSLVTRVASPETAFHANFADDECNETFFAQEAVRGTRTRLYTVNADDAPDLVERLRDIVDDFDEPTVGSVILPLDELMQRVATRYKVVLTGTGGDELFLGYVRYQLAMGECAQDSYRGLFEQTRDLKMGDAWDRFHRKGTEAFYAFDTSEAEADFACEYAEDGYVAFDRRVFLPALLNIDDKIGGRHGLESRPALLHQRLARRVLSVSPAALMRGGLKWLGKAIARPLLPAAIVNRRDKMGFSTPIGTMVNANADRIREQLHSSPFRSLYRLDRPLTAETKWSREVFGLLMLDLWLNRYARADQTQAATYAPATIAAPSCEGTAEDIRKTPVDLGPGDAAEPPEPHTTAPEA